MVRRWLTPRWLGASALALAMMILFIFLGDWQYGRHEARVANRDRIEARYTAPAVPLDQVLPADAGPMDRDGDWIRVEATGQYDRAGQLMARNRPQDGVYGFEVLVPLRLGDGTSLLVDRGWVQNAERAEVLPDVPPAPAGSVRVTGWLRPGEPLFNEQMPTGQLGSINLGLAQEAVGQPLRGAYLVLESENDGSGSEPARPAPLMPPDTGLGPHFAYALQWWAGSIVGFVLVFVYLRREVRDELLESGELVAAAPREKKVRIWDEEDA